MPDWFYRTVSQRALFSLPDAAGRAVALGVIGTLGRSVAGRALIEFMGHMAPEGRLAVTVRGRTYSSPIGLGWRVDPEQRATEGLACFGVGCVERCEGDARAVTRTAAGEMEDAELQIPLSKARREQGKAGEGLWRRIAADGTETLSLPSGEVLPVVAWTEVLDEGRGKFAQGVVVQAGTWVGPGRWRVPSRMPEELPRVVRAWRTKLGAEAVVVVAGGAGSPADAVALVEAGASLILIDAGLVLHGPGLIKRCNAALLQQGQARTEPAKETGLWRRSWIWAGGLGTAMALGGAVTLGLALTRVLLPYDEHYLGLTSATLRRTMPRLFAFMAHDRGTLAGTMLGLGWLYGVLAWEGVRRNVHGTKTTVIASALAGFASFFAFFGFGYFDTLHAFVAAILFQITVQIMTGEAGGARQPVHLPDEEDSTWRRAQWGQLLWVVHSVGLLIAGGFILSISVTSVFVSEDLGFLCMTAAEVQAMGERVVSVVAHDRATLGGMLLASGVAMLLPVLWNYERGAAWLWRAMAGLGLPAYGAALGVHLWVGYDDWRHAVPAWLGLGLWAGGLGLSRPYLLKRGNAASR
jgi:dihydroorotate dehydrogenase